MRSELTVSSQKSRIKPSRTPKEHKPRGFWVKVCQAYKCSSLSPRKFSESEGLSHSTFHRWLTRLELEGALDIGSFIPIEVDASPAPLTEPYIARQVAANLPSEEGIPETSPELKLTLNRGLVLSIPKDFDAHTLRKVVEALGC